MASEWRGGAAGRAREKITSSHKITRELRNIASFRCEKRHESHLLNFLSVSRAWPDQFYLSFERKELAA